MIGALAAQLARHSIVLLAVGVAAGWWLFPAIAHQINITTARVSLSPDRVVTVEVALKASDLDRAAGTRVFDERTGLVDPARLAGSSTVIAAYVTEHAIVMGTDNTPCDVAPPVVTPDQDGVAVRAFWSCRKVGGDLEYRSTVLVDIAPETRQVVLLGDGPSASQVLLDARHNGVGLTVRPAPFIEVVGEYVRAGIEHILIGYDHIAFLIAVVLWARRVWPVVKLVTAFTLAHSITLSLAALKVVVIPSALVEPAIAASIVFVAVENFFCREIGGRWRVTFAFGLIHGFGFASALQEFGLPQGSVLPALASFNVGVEIGQVAIVSMVVPLLIGIDRQLGTSPSANLSRPASFVYLSSGVIAILGCYWAFERIFLA